MRWIRWPGLRPLLCNPIDRHRVPLTPSIRSLSSHISALCFFPSRFTQLTLPTAPATLEVFFFSFVDRVPPSAGERERRSRRAFAPGSSCRSSVCIWMRKRSAGTLHTPSSVYLLVWDHRSKYIHNMSGAFIWVFFFVCVRWVRRTYIYGRGPIPQPLSSRQPHQPADVLVVRVLLRQRHHIYIYIVGERLLARVKSILVPSRETCDFQPRICMSRPCDYTSQRRMRYYRQQPGNKDIAMHTYS